MKSRENEIALPWYLRKTPFLILAFCFVPAACILILFNWNRLDNEEKENRFFIASILLLIFSIGFMPRNFISIALATAVFLFICALSIAVLSKKN